MKWQRPIIYGLLVIGALVFLAVLTPRQGGPTTGGKRIAAQTQIASFIVCLDAFEMDTGVYPKALAELVAPLPGSTNWHGSYLSGGQIPIDPWQREYLYTYPGKHNTNSFDLMSAGSDGQAGTDDDITNWQPKH